ncbi:hypothetical protein HAX54_038972 [Datura stramonium]|uniref:Uncharacterized protein n=1 Tax=Datura stramonium TaxID=4076 RepID=A0ABS8SIY5_DATST|nr:hypothetical protein [Datura stramonium]
MIISRILKAGSIDLSKYPAKEVSPIYDNPAFASMGYILSEEKWSKKAGFTPKLKAVVDEPQSGVNSNVVQSIPLQNLLKDVEEIKTSLGAIVDDLHKIQTSLSQHEGVKSFHSVLKQVDSGATRAKVSNNELTVAVQNSYASFSKNIKKSYHSSLSVSLTLKYFGADLKLLMSVDKLHAPVVGLLSPFYFYFQ